MPIDNIYAETQCESVTITSRVSNYTVLLWRDNAIRNQSCFLMNKCVNENIYETHFISTEPGLGLGFTDDTLFLDFAESVHMSVFWAETMKNENEVKKIFKIFVLRLGLKSIFCKQSSKKIAVFKKTRWRWIVMPM